MRDVKNRHTVKTGLHSFMSTALSRPLRVPALGDPKEMTP
jgi:hypothetical protein